MRLKLKNCHRTASGRLLSIEETVTSLERTALVPLVESFICILQECRKKKNPGNAKRLHAYMCKSGLEVHKSLGNYLVPMLAECGSMGNAQQVFNRLPNRNEYSWTSLISGYIESGESQMALSVYQKMQEYVHPSQYTFLAVLKACARLEHVEGGQEMHAEIARRGLEREPCIGNTLIDMYSKCGILIWAREVFDKLPVRDVVSWNILITGYAEHGLGEEALNCFAQMQLEGASPDAFTVVCSLKACGSRGDIAKGREIHLDITRKGFERDPFVGSALVDMYAKCGSIAKAQKVFDKLPVPDVVLWNALMAGYVEYGFDQEALNCFEQMQLGGVSPNAVTLVCSLKACGSIQAIDKGREIHMGIARKGLEGNCFVGNTLVDMYAKCGWLARAQEVFDKLPIQVDVSWNILIAGYVEHGLCEEALNCLEQMRLEGVSPDTVTFVCSLRACGIMGAINRGRDIHAEVAREGLELEPCVGNTLVDMYTKCGSLLRAHEIFDKLPVRDVVSWNILMSAYVEHGLGQEALSCFKQMQMEGASPDAFTFVCSLKACGSSGDIDKGREIHAEIARQEWERDPFVGNSLVDMYAKCGSLSKARSMFDQLPVRDIVSWNVLIAGYAQLGESEIVFHMLQGMRSDGMKPSEVTFLIALTACSHAGLVDKGQKYFEAMRRDDSVTSTIEHHTCMVDLLGRAGQLDKAAAMVEDMPFQPNLVIWHTFLGACRKWGDMELGRQAFKHTLQLDENDASAYVLMYNIYADVHMQEDEMAG